MSEWKTYKLGEIYEFSSGLSKGKEFFGKGHDFVTFKDVFQNYFLPKKLTSLVESNGKEQNSCSVLKGDVFLTRTSENDSELGLSSVALKDYPHATFNGFTKRLRPKGNVEIIPEYAGFYFRSSKFRKRLSQFATMTTRASLNNEILANLTIDLPDKNTQFQIGNTLKSIDDKIELNLQMNQTLEAMAQALFKEWFVNFNFPNFDGKLENGLPKGWRKGKLNEIVDVKGGTTPSTTKEEYWNGEFYWTTPKDLSNIQSPVLIDTERKITELGVRQIGSGVMPKGTLLLSSRAPIGYIAISQVPISINQGYIAIQGKLVSNLFMLFWLKQNMDAVKSKANGSTFQEISKSNFREIETIIPSNERLSLFEQTAVPIFEKIVENVFQIQTLTQTRDTLLPKLMSGKIEIKK